MANSITRNQFCYLAQIGEMFYALARPSSRANASVIAVSITIPTQADSNSVNYLRITRQVHSATFQHNRLHRHRHCLQPVFEIPSRESSGVHVAIRFTFNVCFEALCGEQFSLTALPLDPRAHKSNEKKRELALGAWDCRQLKRLVMHLT